MGSIKHIAIIGGGIAGMETAISLIGNNYKITIIEKEGTNGGKLNNWHCLFPDFSKPETILSALRKRISTEKIDVIYNTEISDIQKEDNRFVLSDKNQNVKFYSDCVVLACGINLFNASLKEEYGYKVFNNVITSADFEQLMKTHGELKTASGNIPKRIAIVHCVGSRDAKSGNTYCSKVCCITGIKQAIEINANMPDCEVYNFYIDLRLYGSTFDDLYLKAQQQHKIQFIRGRVSEISECNDSRLQLKAEDTLSGKPLRMDVDMVILLIGMEACSAKENIIANNDVELDQHKFFKSEDAHYNRNKTTNRGIFITGACTCPMSVNDTLENARSCALSITQYLEQDGFKPGLS